MKQKGPYNIDLQKAVQYLYGQGRISKDNDIVDKTGYSKAVVSSYVNGKSEMSQKFKESFETVFKVRLSDFGSSPLFIPDVDAYLVSKVKKIEAIAELLLKLKAEENAEKTNRDSAVVEAEYWRTIEGIVGSNLSQ